MKVHLKSISLLDKILKNSLLDETHKDTNNDIAIDGVQRFYGALEIDGNKYREKTTVKNKAKRKRKLLYV